jgi:hypothetical protein
LHTDGYANKFKRAYNNFRTTDTVKGKWITEDGDMSQWESPGAGINITWPGYIVQNAVTVTFGLSASSPNGLGSFFSQLSY